MKTFAQCFQKQAEIPANPACFFDINHLFFSFMKTFALHKYSCNSLFLYTVCCINRHVIFNRKAPPGNYPAGRFDTHFFRYFYICFIYLRMVFLKYRNNCVTIGIHNVLANLIGQQCIQQCLRLS